MNKKLKVKLIADGSEGFFARTREHARKLDRGEKLEPEIVISFEDASDLVRVLSVQRLRLLRASKKATPVSALATAVKRNLRAVSRDIDLLESFGLLRTHYEPNPGHGRRKIVKSSAERYQLVANI